MNMSPSFSLHWAIVAGLMLSATVQAGGPMSQGDYQAGKTRIDADYKAQRGACDGLARNDKDVCVLEAKGREKVAMAELEYGYSAKPADQRKLGEIKADAAYAVAKEKCDELAGTRKNVCVEEAKAQQSKALADAHMGQQIDAARQDAVGAGRDADHRVAIEKCGGLAGDAKAGCLAAAEARFGKR